MFLFAALGSSIGLGNIWKYPYLAWKHGGIVWILAYLFALFIVGCPMLILELTLGQKMQRGSAGSIRGILPRFAGAGWAASFASFVTAVVYIILLGIVAVYLVQSGSKPWKDDLFNPETPTEGAATRPKACNEGEYKAIPSAEVFLYNNVVHLYNQTTCEPYKADGNDDIRFSGGLFGAVCVTWILCFFAVAFGPKSMAGIATVTCTLPFIFLFVCMAGFIGLNNKVGGKGLSYYWNQTPFPQEDANGKFVDYDPSSELGNIMQDAYSQVFFSVGICVGVMISYGSYNPIKQTVIANAIFICIMDFIFSLLAGFITWGAIGYLQKVGDPNYDQNKSIGLTFIAFPAVAAREEDMGGMFTVFCILLYVAGIDSAYSYVESLVCNILDHWRVNSTMHLGQRVGVTAFVCIMGIALSAVFTTNFGWILFDLVDHYMSSYIIIAVGLM